jgi:hypothetical protein
LKLSREIFEKQQSGPWLYDANVFQAKLEEFLETIFESKDATLFDDRADACRTFVVAVRHHQIVDAPPVLLKSYSLMELRYNVPSFKQLEPQLQPPHFSLLNLSV